MTHAGYIDLFQTGELRSMIGRLEELCRNCRVCPHQCKVDRFGIRRGKCNTTAFPVISSWGPHFGEEPPLVGHHGSGTIFLTNCNLGCIYCQNYDISQLGHGEEIPIQQLSDTMIHLQERGCHNINFVTPTHQVYSIIKALELAIPKGLHIPLVYNSGGYDLVSTLQIVEGVFDIYMPDFKFYYAHSAGHLCGASDYPAVAMAAITEMHRQVGDLVTDSAEIAERGLIVRHLILPGHVEEAKRIIDFISSLSKGTYFNLMEQYRPAFKAYDQRTLNSRVSPHEYQELLEYAVNKGLRLAF